jgi:soluble lytic murein transglycosylase
MMQVMPGTARDVARKLGVPYRASALTSDADYNIQIGSAYLEHLLDIFDGSYVLAVAAYNAGPARVAGWVRDMGDPRKGEIDNIDWIEQIPIAETRNYVQRVLEAVYIYRIKLRDVQKSYNSPLVPPAAH